MTGTVYFTPEEWELFKKDYSDRSKSFYIPRGVDIDDVGNIRPLVTEEYMLDTHYLLNKYSYENEDGEEEVKIYFEHYRDGYEKSCYLDYEVINFHPPAGFQESIDIMLQTNPPELVAAHLKRKAKELESDDT